MIPIPVKVTARSVPSDYTPPNDMQGVLEAVAQYTDYEAQADGPAVVANSTGQGADINSIWANLLGPGSPQNPLAPRTLAWYQGSWEQVYTGKPGEIRLFCGPSWAYFDASGFGLPDSGWEGWGLCNGQNGTVQLLSRFIVPGYRYASGQGWVTQVGGWLDAPSRFPHPGLPGEIGGGGYGYPEIWPYLTFDENYYVSLFAGSGSDWKYLFQTGIDSFVGGWQLFKIATWNLGNSTFSAEGQPQIYAGVNVDLNSNGTFNMTAGGEVSISAPGPSSSTGDPVVGQWMYPLDQTPDFINLNISRIPPYIALGYAQFVGYR